MQLKQWLETKADVPDIPVPGAVPNITFSQFYANKLIDAGIQDDERDLPKVGLTWEDLKEIGVAVGYRHRILKAIQKIAPPELKRDGTDDAKDRHDLIKRFVPIALSVGFAARLVDIDWIKKGTPITYDELEQFARLFTGVFVAVSGWEWYHRDLRWHPLDDAGRFFVDVAVVITTIVFLYSAKDPAHWFGFLILIFALYLIWDALTFRQYKQDFYPSTSDLGFYPLRGPITDALWTFYFIALAYAALWPFSKYDYQTFVDCLFVFVGALSLRLLASKPKKMPDGTWEKMSAGELIWAAVWRVLVVVVLLALYLIVSAGHIANCVSLLVVYAKSLL
jgi:hypothetical protein